MPESEIGEGRWSRDEFTRTERVLDAISPRLPQDTLEALAREVVGRLASRVAAARTGPGDRVADIAEFVDLLTSGPPGAAAGHVDGLLDMGTTVEEIYLVHLTGAAHALGGLWDEDRISFAEVSLAAGRIYAILRGLRPALRDRAGPPVAHAVFASVPGEDHTLGVSMAADLFRHHGWEIDLKIGMEHDRLIAEIERSEASLIGLSGGGEHSVPAMARLIVALRAARPEAHVLVGGQVVCEAPDAVRLMGPDAMAADAESAEAMLRRFAAGAIPA